MYVGAFGPITWDVMLLCALAYPIHPTDEDKQNMLNFLNGLMYVLPCSGCSVHAVAYVYQNIPDVSSSNALLSYIVKFHNFVNTQSGKRTFTVEEATQLIIKRYLTDDLEMDRAQSIRVEDHARITKLQKKLDDKHYCSPIDYFVLTNNIVLALVVIIGLSICIWKITRLKIPVCPIQNPSA
jgi:hypothetical protein